MDDLYYKNKYRIPSARYAGYDYNNDGLYFVTICTRERKLLFGNVQNYEMKLSKVGEIAYKCWIEISKHFSYVRLDEFIVMPNHIHGIFEIARAQSIVETEHAPCNNVETGHAPCNNVETGHAPSLQGREEYTGNYPQMSKISRTKGSLSIIIGSFKSAVTKEVNEKFPEIKFAWQEKFHDHIIKNDNEAKEIRIYIMGNPARWELDRNNPKNFNIHFNKLPCL